MAIHSTLAGPRPALVGHTDASRVRQLTRPQRTLSTAEHTQHWARANHTVCYTTLSINGTCSSSPAYLAEARSWSMDYQRFPSQTLPCPSSSLLLLGSKRGDQSPGELCSHPAIRDSIRGGKGMGGGFIDNPWRWGRRAGIEVVSQLRLSGVSAQWFKEVPHIRCELVDTPGYVRSSKYSREERRQVLRRLTLSAGGQKAQTGFPGPNPAWSYFPEGPWRAFVFLRGRATFLTFSGLIFCLQSQKQSTLYGGHTPVLGPLPLLPTNRDASMVQRTHQAMRNNPSAQGGPNCHI